MFGLVFDAIVLILVTAVIGGLYLLVAGLGLWAAAHAMGRWASTTLSVSLIGYFLYSTWATHSSCTATLDVDIEIVDENLGYVLCPLNYSVFPSLILITGIIARRIWIDLGRSRHGSRS